MKSSNTPKLNTPEVSNAFNAYRPLLALVAVCLLTACQQEDRASAPVDASRQLEPARQSAAAVAKTPPAAPTLEQRQQLLGLQLQQQLMLQTLQTQQQVDDTTADVLQQHGKMIEQQIHTESITRACATTDNCRVETQIVPAD